MNELQQLAGCGEDWAAKRAQYALQVAQALQQGQIGKDEAREILSDLVNTDKLNQEATNLQMKQMLVYGITQIAEQLL